MMAQGELRFKYEVENQGEGMTGRGGIGPYLDLACRSGMVRSIERHVKAQGEQGWTDAEVSVREPISGRWVLIEEITCGTLENWPGNGTCHSDYYCIEGGYRYLDSWLAGTNMGYRWHPSGDCIKYPCTPYDRNYCYDPGFYPPFYHVGIHSKKMWRWDCP